VNAGGLSSRATGPLAPLFGIFVGVLGGAIYWLAAQIWPSSVAVILAMTGTALLTTDTRAVATTRLDLLGRTLCLLVKFNALMALSAAKLPFAAPQNTSLGLIMVCGYAASFALLLLSAGARPLETTPKIGHGSLIVALLIGFAPAALLGIPGLIGLAAAVVAGICTIAFMRYKKIRGSIELRDHAQLTAEACFYLGALASWRFV
jgi:cobalamin synthase